MAIQSHCRGPLIPLNRRVDIALLREPGVDALLQLQTAGRERRSSGPCL